MTGRWSWEYNPDFAQVAGGLPPDVVKEVERLADQLVELGDMGVDLTDLNESRSRRGLCQMKFTSGGYASPGWFHFLPAEGIQLIAIVKIVPPFEAL
ncbi:MAG: hypothetical protein ACRDNL_10740 [Spirillospora sp.]